MQQTAKATRPRSKPLAPNKSLWDTLPVWRKNPTEAFNHWVNGQNLTESTRKQYRWMFNHLIDYLGEQGVSLHEASIQNLQKFFAKASDRPLAKQHAARYADILRWVFDHMAILGYRGRNLGKDLLSLGLEDNRDTAFLLSGEVEALLGAFPAKTEQIIKTIPTPAPGTPLDVGSRKYREAWLSLRDLALVSAMFGAGLRVEQVRALAVCCINLPSADVRLGKGIKAGAWIDVPRIGRDRAHRAAILDSCVPTLRAWLQHHPHREAAGAGVMALAFPSDLMGNGYKRKASERPAHPALAKMSSSQVFRRVNGYLLEQGVAPSAAHPQALRNTYALMLANVRPEIPLEQLLESLGLGEYGWARLRCAMQAWTEAESARLANFGE